MARILVVEDDPDVRSFLLQAFEFAGHQTTEACDGLEGLAAFERNPFDLVFSDHDMPGLDGATLLDRIRTLAPDCPTILCTGTPEPEQIAAARATTTLEKPVDLFELCRAVEQALPLPLRSSEQKPAPAGRRAHPRRPVRCPIVVTTNARSHAGQTVDLSPGGVGIELNVPDFESDWLEGSSPVDLEIGTGGELRIGAVATNQHPTGDDPLRKRVGLCFQLVTT